MADAWTNEYEPVGKLRVVLFELMASRTPVAKSAARLQKPSPSPGSRPSASA